MVSAGYPDITQEVAQKASCLAPKTFVSTYRIVKAALLAASNETPNVSPVKPPDEKDPTAYANLITKHKIGRPLLVEKWMEDAQAALIALPRFQHDLVSRLAEPSVEVRIAVFYWVCRAIKVRCSLNRHAKDSLHNFFFSFLSSSRLCSMYRWPTSMAHRSRTPIAS